MKILAKKEWLLVFEQFDFVKNAGGKNVAGDGGLIGMASNDLS